jgi:hypothetical protein
VQQIRLDLLHQPGKLLRHMTGVQAGFYLEGLRMSNVQARQHFHRDAGIPGLTATSQDAHVVTGAVELFSLVVQDSLNAAYYRWSRKMQ